MPNGSRFGSSCCCGTGGAPTQPCNACPVPVTLSCTWRYRSYNYPGGVPHCMPGAAINAITFNVVYTPAAVGWLSDYIQIFDHNWEAGCTVGGTSIPVGDWVRLIIKCSPGAGFNLFYLPTSDNPTACYPGQNFGGCSTVGQFTIGVGIDSCTPFHASGFIAQGPTYNEAANTYCERWDFTPP